MNDSIEIGLHRHHSGNEYLVLVAAGHSGTPGHRDY